MCNVDKVRQQSRKIVCLHFPFTFFAVADALLQMIRRSADPLRECLISQLTQLRLLLNMNSLIAVSLISAHVPRTYMQHTLQILFQLCRNRNRKQSIPISFSQKHYSFSFACGLYHQYSQSICKHLNI